MGNRVPSYGYGYSSRILSKLFPCLSGKMSGDFSCHKCMHLNWTGYRDASLLCSGVSHWSNEWMVVVCI